MSGTDSHEQSAPSGQPRYTRGRVVLRASTPEDCPFVTALESRPEIAAHVGQWPPERHLEAMRRADKAHWVVESRGERAGYAILEDVDDPDGSILLRRIAVSGAGRGLGRSALELLLRHCFEHIGCHRVWLFVAATNRRAGRLYQRLGFVEEGIARECARDGERYISMHIMSMLEREYRERRRR